MKPIAPGFLQEPNTLATVRFLVLARRAQELSALDRILATTSWHYVLQMVETLAQVQNRCERERYDVAIWMPSGAEPEALDIWESIGKLLPIVAIVEDLNQEIALQWNERGLGPCLLRSRLDKLPRVLERLADRSRILGGVWRQGGQEPENPLAGTNWDLLASLLENSQLSAVYRVLVHWLWQRYECDLCWVFRWDAHCPQWGEAIAVASGWAETKRPMAEKLNPEEGLAIARGQPIARVETTQESATSRLLVPLRSEGITYGGIGLLRFSRVRWSCEEIEAIAAVARRGEIVLSLLRRSESDFALATLAGSLVACGSTNEVIQACLAEMGRYLGVERASFFSLTGSMLRVSQQWHTHGSIVSILGEEITRSSLLETYQRWGGAVVVSDWVARVAAHPHLARLFPVATQSLLSVPVFCNSHLFGILALDVTQTKHCFDATEVEFVKQAVAVLEKMLRWATELESDRELVGQLNEKLERERLISDRGSTLSRSELIASMNHELRTPLTSILGFSRMLEKQIYGPLNQKQQQYTSALVRCGEYLLELINDLLDLSKVEAGGEELLLEAVEVEELCQASLAMVQGRASDRHLALRLNLAPEVSLAYGDRRRLQQILVNLLSNAVKFTEVGSVTLEVKLKGQRLEFAVIDTGIGIPETELDNLFIPFRQIKNTANRKYKGTGLGLALSRKLAHLHGGEITVTSQLGVGSCFTFSLPLQGEPPQNSSPGD